MSDETLTVTPTRSEQLAFETSPKLASVTAIFGPYLLIVIGLASYPIQGVPKDISGGLVLAGLAILKSMN